MSEQGNATIAPMRDAPSCRSNFAERKFERLAGIESLPISQSALLSALQSVFWKIKHPVLSAWGEHIPFMFGLVTLIKPRRYVELGVHNGGSFLAACQAARSNGLTGSFVAIDNWLGDAHAGVLSSDVFENFKSSIAEYDDIAGYIRSDFEQAASQFEDGSIDLLHIDGFHTAEAVERDFRTWLPKLSEDAIVIFHDTNEFQSDFGVWRFWRSIRQQYPHIEFGHGHGLGILMVGSSSPLRKPLEGWSSALTSPLSNELLQVIFGGVGFLSIRDARRPLPPVPKPALLSENEKLKRDLAEAQQSAARWKSEADALRQSTSWRVTKPLRAIASLFKLGLHARSRNEH